MRNKTTIGRLLCLFLALCLSLSVWPITASAAGSGDIAIDAAHFPDDNFRGSVRIYDRDNNSILSEQERTNVTKMFIYNKGIASLQGIEYFPALRELYCNDNKITSLDMSKNPNLRLLFCNNNQLTTLDVSKNTSLIDLRCGNNLLPRLDVTQNTALKYLYCYENQLTTLDVSENTALMELSCYDNALSTLDVSKNIALSSLLCQINQLTTLDVSKNVNLSTLNCSKNHLTSMNVSDNPHLVWLYTTIRDNFYELPQRHDFDYTTLPGNFNVDKVSNVVGGSFNTKDHTFRFEDGKTVATYTYDIGMGLEATFALYTRNPFNDVHKKNFFYDSVIWAVENKITDGTTPSTFSPEKECTRAQVVTFLWRAAGSPRPKNYYSSPFQDVQNRSTFYYQAVLWAAEQGITSGITPNTFNPSGTCTRGQVVTFLWRFKNKPQPQNTNSSFVDVQNPSNFYYNAVLWAAENKITDGVAPNVFRPEGTCKRGQIVTFLYRCLKQG